MNFLLSLVGGVCAGGAVALGYRAALQAVDRLNADYETDLRDRMERIGLDTANLNAWMRGRVFWAITVAVALGFAGMVPVGLLSAAATFMLLPSILESRILRTRTEIRDQLVLATRNLAGQIRGKQILVRGLARVAEQTPAPLGNLLTGCTRQVARGVRLDAALMELKDRVRMDYMTLLVLTLVVGFEKKEGESLAELLDGIAHSLAENQRLDRKRDADTAAGRLLVNLLACFPIAFLGLFGLLDPAAVGSVFTTLLGQLILCLVGALTWFSVWLARRILGQVI
jgi:Flp pilus assembly protein TadB